MTVITASMVEEVTQRGRDRSGAFNTATDREATTKVIRGRMDREDWARTLRAHCPEALDLHARTLAILSEPLHGVVAYLAESWGLCDGIVRGYVNGSRSMPAYIMAALRTSPTREARAARVAVLQEWARDEGYLLTPMETTSAPAVAETAAQIAEQTGRLMAEHSRAAADGRYDAAEVETLTRTVRDVEALLPRMKSALASAGNRA